MKKFKTILRVSTDAAMFAVYFLLLEHHLLDNFLHEWLGIAAGVLFILHNALNYKWYTALFKGRYTPVRIALTAVNLFLWVSVLCCMVSGIIVSVNLFPSVGGNAIETGRMLHLVSTAWVFILICIHLGLHWSMFAALSKRIPLADKAKSILMWVFRTAIFVFAVWGAYVFIERRFWEEMFLLIDYQKEYDYSKSPVLYFMESAAFASLIVAITYYIKKFCLFIKLKRRQKGKIQ